MEKDKTFLTPEKLTGLKKEAAKTNSVGLKALSSGAQQILKYMNPADASKVLAKLNQKDGLDCPGCAWPDPDDERATLAEYCENGIKAIAEEATKKVIPTSFFAENSLSDLQKLSDFEIGKTGRLTVPMVLNDAGTHYQETTWTKAYKLIAEELKALPSPDDAIFYTSGRTSNEAAFLYQLFVRAFGTNNLPDCSNMCHESSGKALSETVGIGKGSVTLKDIYESELLIVMGQNPGTNHPRMLTALEKAKENGAQIITVNPLPEAGLMKFTNPQRPLKVLSGGTKLTDLFVPVQINGDVAFLKAVMLVLLEMEETQGGIVDQAFIKKYCEGYDSFKSDLQEHSLAVMTTACGVSEKLIRQVAEMVAAKSKIIICWAMGLTQHENGVDNIREVVNLLLMRGSIGKAGAGTCPVRGHSNVQGDRTMGIWEAPKEAFLDKLETVFQIKSPREHGLAVVDSIKTMYEETGKVFFGMGGNFLSAAPDTAYTAVGLQNCALTVQVSTKLNRTHLAPGKKALILPCLGRTDIDVQDGKEQFVSVENSMGVVHSSKGVLKPCADNLKSEVRIVCELALAYFGSGSNIKWQDYANNYDLIRDDIEKVIPGFDNYNKRVRNPSGFHLPNGARVREFNTANGKANFSTNALPNNPLAEDELLMMTIRSHDQFNTTIYGLDDRYRGIKNERRVVLMNEKDMTRFDLAEGELVDISSTYDGDRRLVEKFIIVSYAIPERCVATYFPEANAVVPFNRYARGSKTPISKSVRVRLHKHNQKISSSS